VVHYHWRRADDVSSTSFALKLEPPQGLLSSGDASYCSLRSDLDIFGHKSCIITEGAYLSVSIHVLLCPQLRSTSMAEP
jgi:hypothetical protein